MQVIDTNNLGYNEIFQLGLLMETIGYSGIPEKYGIPETFFYNFDEGYAECITDKHVVISDYNVKNIIIGKLETPEELLELGYSDEEIADIYRGNIDLEDDLER